MFRSGSILLACLLCCAGAVEPLRAPADPFFVSPPGLRPDDNVAPIAEDSGELEFTLRHIYHRGTHRHPQVHRYLDVSSEATLIVADDVTQTEVQAPGRLKARTKSISVERMRDRSRDAIESLRNYAVTYGHTAPLSASDWTIDRISGPDVSDKPTLINLAWMAANAYTEKPGTGDWKDVKGGFNESDDFGWEGDGLRGHIFATKDNSTVVIGLKGTSMAYFEGDETTGNDKINDNLFGSCCCAQDVGFMHKPSCGCTTDTFTCNNTCVVRELHAKDRYYLAAQELYHNVTERYPKSSVWLSGHSLGGVVSSLLGLTYGLPTVTFEAYPDALAASRLGLPVPPGYRAGSHQSRTDVAIHHFGHTADPIFIAQCHGTFSPCSIYGYDFESACHTGKKCVYDTVSDKSWRVGISYHRILSVISDVLEAYDEAASCAEFLECTDCFNWKFYDTNSSETTTSSKGQATKTYTRTRTETCKTPGWWGCLDESTTTGPTTTSTMTITSTTCKTPGWFGCKDSTTTPMSSTITKPATRPAITTVTTTTTTTRSSSTSCSTPGFFGCKDETTTTAPSIAPSSSAMPSFTSDYCSSRIWFGLICADEPNSTSTSPSSTPSRRPGGGRRECARRYWFGLCKKWRLVTDDDSDEALKGDL